MSLAVSSTSELDKYVAAHDVVVSLLSHIHHPNVIISAIRGKTHVVTTSYVSPSVRAWDESAKQAGITVLMEVGGI